MLRCTVGGGHQGLVTALDGAGQGTTLVELHGLHARLRNRGSSTMLSRAALLSMQWPPGACLHSGWGWSGSRAH